MRPKRWTKALITQVFDDFIEQHDRLPTRQEMYEKYAGQFPRPNSIKVVFGITIGEFFKSNYGEYINRCNSLHYGRVSKEYWIENFKSQYIALDYPFRFEYNAKRDPKTPNAQTMAKIVGVSTWEELLNYCGLSKYKKKEFKVELEFEETLENYQKLSSKLQKIVKTFK